MNANHASWSEKFDFRGRSVNLTSYNLEDHFQNLDNLLIKGN